MTDVRVPIPGPFKVAMIISDGRKYAYVDVDREILESDPAGAVGAAMAALDGVISQDGVLGIGTPAKIDIVRTDRGWALTPSSMDWLKQNSHKEGHSGDGQ